MVRGVDFLYALLTHFFLTPLYDYCMYLIYTYNAVITWSTPVQLLNSCSLTTSGEVEGLET